MPRPFLGAPAHADDDLRRLRAGRCGGVLTLILRDPELAIDAPLDDLSQLAVDPNPPLFEPNPNRGRG